MEHTTDKSDFFLYRTHKIMKFKFPMKHISVWQSPLQYAQFDHSYDLFDMSFLML